MSAAGNTQAANGTPMEGCAAAVVASVGAL